MPPRKSLLLFAFVIWTGCAGAAPRSDEPQAPELEPAAVAKPLPKTEEPSLPVPVERPEQPPVVSSPAPSKPLGDGIIRRRSEDGPLILAQPDAKSERVVIQAVLPAGLRFESDDNCGIGWLLAVLLGRATDGLAAGQLAQEIEKGKGTLGGVWGMNYIGLRADFPAAEGRRAAELLCDCLMHPVFPEEEVSRARQAALRRIRAGREDPSALSFFLLAENLYRKHPYRLSAQGMLGSVARLDAERLAEHWKSIFHPRRLVVSVVGGDAGGIADLTGRLCAAGEKKPAEPPAVALEPPLAKSIEIVRHLAAENAAAWIGFPGVTVGSPDRDAIEVLMTLLSGPDGRLGRELCGDKPPALEVSGYFLDGIEPGYLAFGLTCAPAKLDGALAALRQQLSRAAKDPVDEEELKSAKKHLIESQAKAWGRAPDRALMLALSELYGLGFSWAADFENRIQSVTAGQLSAVASRYLRLDHSVTSIVRP